MLPCVGHEISRTVSFETLNARTPRIWLCLDPDSFVRRDSGKHRSRDRHLHWSKRLFPASTIAQGRLSEFGNRISRKIHERAPTNLTPSLPRTWQAAGGILQISKLHQRECQPDCDL